MSKLKIGQIVTPLGFVPGHPIGAGVDTRCIVREVRGDRIRVDREDGRGSSLWMDRAAVRRWGW